MTVRERTFNLAEKMPPILFKCEMHNWMKAYVGVLPHPFFAVTDEHGHFSIQGVPEGEWDLVVWHEMKGKQNTKVTVPKGGMAVVNDVVFEF